MSNSNNDLRISYWVRANRYAGTCVGCDQAVAENAGWTQKEGDVWQTICQTCARAHAKYLPDGNKFMSAINGTQEGGNAYKCVTCDRHVALVKSARTGKWYFCEVGETDAGNVYALTHQPHTVENCTERKSTNDRDLLIMERDEALKTLAREYNAQLDKDGGIGEIDSDTLRAHLEAYHAKHNAVRAQYQSRIDALDNDEEEEF